MNRSLALLFDVLLWALAAWVMYLMENDSGKAVVYWNASRYCYITSAWFHRKAKRLEQLYVAELGI